MEARRSYRLDLAAELTLSAGQQSLHGTVLNIGLSGIMAHMPTKLDPDARYLISFQLRPEKSIFKSWAVVAWTQEHDADSYLAGLQFERTDSAMHRMIADYISNRWISEHLSPGAYGTRS